jgi:hypothetical protein
MRLKEMAQPIDENPRSPTDKEERKRRRDENAERKQEREIRRAERLRQKHELLIVPMRKKFAELYQKTESTPCPAIFQVIAQAGIEQALGLRRHLNTWEIATEILQGGKTDIPGVDLCDETEISKGIFYGKTPLFYRTIDKMMAAQGITEIDGILVHTTKRLFGKYIIENLVGDLSLKLGIISGDNPIEPEDGGNTDSSGQPTNPPTNPAGGEDAIYVELNNSQDSLPINTTEWEADNSEHSSAALSPDPDINSGSE